MTMSTSKCKNIKWLAITILIFIHVQEGESIKWLALSKASDVRIWTKEACSGAKTSGYLERKQARACRSTPDIMPNLIQAARDTASVCQQVFKDRRWNCSSIELAPRYTPDLLTGTRERAFVHAMSAAAAIWRLARACALGNLAICSCATPPRRVPPLIIPHTSLSLLRTNSALLDASAAKSLFKWGGCGDDVKSASRITKMFLQSSSSSSLGATGRFLHTVDMHNSRAGRRTVEQSLSLECKCHGVSGSCSVRTCWRGLDSKGPGAAGTRIFKKYSTAAEVRPKLGRLPPLYHHDNLLYTTKSVDYCSLDKKHGSLGTIGRQCNGNGSSLGYAGCEYLCCGRGHVTKTRVVLERCECKYISCCYSVQCSTCRNIVTTYECN
ncbi:protein Wnt-11b-2-like [Aphidius gifuensis]|uniref:protein Wnt-11b-2-like n=1 Tax=Aphidius gifuensis TaxID=684658 RepID=UPI001CDBC77F|nr:protein Wnt-11b-2-like [Aphidius gifuensis]